MEENKVIGKGCWWSSGGCISGVWILGCFGLYDFENEG